MSNQINIPVNVSDNGSTKKVTLDAKDLRKELNEVNKEAEKLGNKTSAALQGAKNRSQPPGRPPSGGGSGGVNTPTPEETRNYNSARLTGGTTARDFAAQSQGLGGLVRLYATFAANIYAVSTAFTALKEAANVDKMIEASNKFSVITGNNMNSIAKSLQKATDYTLSFQDAIKFTNIGTSAGLTGKEIKNLTVIAKGAANALGRDVGESIQRIIQGTAKQEQEILDELGIFVKSKKAFEEYAQARNVKVDDLTARQRTIAYADAVAKAGEQWKEFAAIEDPYAKLVATSKQALQEVLSSINKIVTPIIQLFADNADAIKGLALLITTSLVKKALPDLKNAFVDTFSFKNVGAAERVKAAKDAMVKEFADLNAKLLELKQKRDALVTTAIPKNQQSLLLGSRIDPSMIQKGGGTSIDYGLSLKKLSTEIFGGDKTPKDLSVYKKAEDIQNSISKSLKSQLADSKHQDELLTALISKKVIEVGSTEKNLVLTQGTVKYSEELLKVIQKINAEKLLAVSLDKQISSTSKLTAASEKELGKVGILKQNIPVVPDNFIGPPTKEAYSAAQKFAEITTTSVGALGAFKLSLGANAKALQAYNVTAVGTLSSMKAFGVYMTTLPAQIATATAGFAGLRVATATAGAAFSFLGGALTLVGRGFMAALGPISLLWVAWELFGDSIKEFLNLNVTKKMEQEKEATQKFTASLETSSNALIRNSAIIEDATVSSDKYVKSIEARANAYRESINAFEQYKKELEDINNVLGPGSSPEDLTKKFGADSVESVKRATSVISILKQAQKDGALSADQSVKTTEVVNKLGDALADLAKKKNGPAALKAALAEIGPTAQASLEQASKAEEARLAILQKGNAASEGLRKIAQNIESDKIEAQAKGLKGNTDALATYKNLISFAEQYEKAQSKADKTALADKQIADLTELITKTKGLTEETTQLAEARRIVASIAVWEQVANTAGSNTVALDTARVQLAGLRTELLKVTSGSESARMGMAQWVMAAGEGAKTTKELTDTEKAFISAEKQRIAQMEATNQALQARISLEDRLASSIAQASGREKTGLNEQRIKLIEQEKALAIQKAKLAKYEALARAPKGKDGDAIRKEAPETLAREIQAAESQERTKRINAELDSIQALYNNKLKDTNDKRAHENELLSLRNSIEDAGFNAAKEESIRRLENLGYLKEEIDLYSNKLDKQKLLTDSAREVAKLDRERQQAVSDSNSGFERAKKDAKTIGGPDLANKLTDISSQQAAREAEINAKYQERMGLATQLLNVQLNQNAALEEQKNIVAQQAKEMSKVSKLAGSLEKAFAGTGLEKQGKALASFIKSSTNGKQKLAQLDNAEKKRKQDISKLEEEAKNGSLKAQSELNMMRFTNAEAEQRYAEERKEVEFEATMSALEGFKSLMSEKTAGYKLISGIERAMYTYKMVMDAKALASDIAATAQFVANGFKKIAVNSTEAVTNQGKGDPYTAFARIAAMIALMASITGKSSGASAGAPPAGTTAKDRQETQGTGTSWVNGKKVENGGGVFGDAEAKSESIKNSLEIIKENSIEGLSFDNKMLKALENIDKAISGVSVSLYRIPGIRTGSSFGTEEGTNGSKALWGLFGSKSKSTEIIDSGVKLAGTFAELASGGQGLINFYETVKTTTTKSGFLGLGKKTSTAIDTKTTGAPSEITQAVSSVFQYATTLFKDVGSKIGKTAEEIDTQLSGINFDQLLSLRDLKGADLEKEFNAVISSMLDSTADTLFAEMKRFQKFGEGMLETVVRVVDANKKLNDGLNAIGQSSALKSANKSLNYDITEKLLEAVGGLENFTDQVEYFRDTFLSEAERIAPVASAVKEEMNRLGYGLVDTRAEFKALVQGLDLTIPAQQELYASLMNVAKSFAEVYEETQKVLDQQEYRGRIADLEINGLRLLGMESAAVRTERALEIEELRKLVPAQADQLIYYQKVTWAIEDSMEIRNAEIEVLGALGFTYDQLVLQREVELMGLNDNLRAIKKWQFAVEDYNASQDLMIELLGHVGDGTRATALTRERELKGLNATDKAIKRAIYAMEDEESIREKLKEIREEETSTLKDNINATKDYIKTLKDYKSSLLTGNLSTLTPTQKYEQLKSEVLTLAAKASAPATTEAEIKAQKEARDKLQSSTSAWLEASRILFASSDSYTNDFKSVLSLVDSVSAAAASSLSDAERQLEVLKTSETLLGGIEENTKTSAQLMADLAVAQANTAAAMAAVPENLASVYKVDELMTYIAGLPQAIASLPDALTTAINSVIATGSASLPSLPGLPLAGFVGPLPPGGYIPPNNPVLAGGTPAEQSMIEMTGYTVEGNVLTRQLIDEVIALKEAVVAMKQEARENTGAVIEAEVNSAVITGDRVTTGVSSAVNLAVWNSNNAVMLR